MQAASILRQCVMLYAGPSLQLSGHAHHPKGKAGDIVSEASALILEGLMDGPPGHKQQSVEGPDGVPASHRCFEIPQQEVGKDR